MWCYRSSCLALMMSVSSILLADGPLDRGDQQPNEFQGTVKQMIEDNQTRLMQRRQRPQIALPPATGVTHQKTVTVAVPDTADTETSGDTVGEDDHTARGLLGNDADSLGLVVPSLEEKMYLVGYHKVSNVAAAEIYYKQVVATFKPGDLLPNGDKLSVITPYHAFVQSTGNGQRSITQLYLTSVTQILEERRRTLDERDRAINQAQELRMFQSSMRGPQ